MLKKYFLQTAFFVVCLAGSAMGATSEDNLPEDQSAQISLSSLSSTNFNLSQLRSTYRPLGCIPSAGRASLHNLLMAGLPHLTAEHPIILNLQAAAAVTSQATTSKTTAPSSSLDLRSFYPDVFDQGELGSCTANALVAAVMFELKKQGITSPAMRSRLFLYYNERFLENDVNLDAGASLSDGISSLKTDGVCLESEWPYDTTKFSKQPSSACFFDAKSTLLKTTNTATVQQNLKTIKTLLEAHTPVVAGITVYSSFQSDQVAQSGIVPMPVLGEQVIGGHAVAFAGYDDAHELFLMRNSWGANWGIGGYFYLPYAYILDPNHTSELWSVGTIVDTLQK